jgi:hypothetical protein
MSTAPSPSFAEATEPYRISRDVRLASTLQPYYRDYTGSPPPLTLMLKIIEVARSLGANPAHLAAVIQHESRFNPKAQYGDVKGVKPFNPDVAQGLIQFTPSTAKGLGTTTRAIRAMDAQQQMDLVQRYYAARARERLEGGPLDTLAKIAMATFYPLYMNKDPSTVFPERVRLANAGIRTPADYLKGITSALRGKLEEVEMLASLPRAAGVFVGAFDTDAALETVIRNKNINYPNLTQYPERFERQMSAGRVVMAEFSRAGIPAGIALAALANAFRESQLDTNAISGRGAWAFGSTRDAVAYVVPAGSEDSRGLFQLNARGAGAGMSSAARHDPTANTQRIIVEYQGERGNRLRQAYANGATVLSLAEIFARDIERPAWRDQFGTEAANANISVMRKFLGPLANVRANTLGAIPAAAGGALVLVGLGLIGAFLYLRRR